MDDERRRGPGRPAEADPERIASIALTMFDERGVDAVSMAEIAQAAGVSRRTLFRWFPAKAALVWGGTVEADERLLAEIDRLDDPDLPFPERVRHAYVAAIRPLSATADITRSRLILLAENPQIRAWGAPLQQALTTTFAERIARLRGEPADSLVALSLAAAYGAASFAALVWWARHGTTDDPSDVLDAALRAVSAPD